MRIIIKFAQVKIATKTELYFNITLIAYTELRPESTLRSILRTPFQAGSAERGSV